MIAYGDERQRRHVGAVLARTAQLYQEYSEEADPLLADAWPTLPPFVQRWLLTRPGVAALLGKPAEPGEAGPAPDPLPPLPGPAGVQARLVEHGLPVPITGVWDERTVDRLQVFQYQCWLEPTGRLDPGTRAFLED